MAINLNNGIVNLQSTPGAITDIYANIPSASGVGIGTLFISTDTGAIYSSDGTNWISVSGGGGGSQDLQQVTNIGNTTTNDIYLTDNTNYTIKVGSAGDFKNSYYDVGINHFYYNHPSEIGFYDIQNAKNFKWVYDDNIFTITTNFNNYTLGYIISSIDFRVVLGDYGSSIKGDYLTIDNTYEQIYTSMSDTPFGILVDRTNRVTLGDINGNFNSTYFSVNDFDQTLLFSNNLKTSSSGSNSGQHLKVNVGGVDYVIQLLNP